MPGQPPATVNYCDQCSASVRPDAKYCQTCGEVISRGEAPRYATDRVIEFSPTYYVTLVSIIQATVLGYLLLAAKDQLSYILTGTYDPIWTVLIVAMFILIVATWVSYTHMVAMPRIKPTTLDALFLFCFGATQGLAIFSISLHQLAWFYFSMTSNALVGLSSYLVVQRNVKSHQEYEENRMLIERHPSFFRQPLPLWYAARSVMFLFFGVAEVLLNLQSLFLAVVVLLMNVISIVGVHLNEKMIAQMISELSYYRR